MKHILLTTLCVVAAASLWAGQPQDPESIKKTISLLLDKLTKDDQYAYRYQVSSVFPDKTKAEIKGTVFKSVSLGMLYTESNKDLDLKYEQGSLFVRATDRQVLWHPFESDSEYHRSIDFMNNTADGLRVLDSLFLRTAELKAVAKSGTDTKVTFSYPAGSAIQNADFVFDPKKQTISSISYEVARPVPAFRGGNATEEVKQRVVMDGFSRLVPQTLARLISTPLNEERLKSLYKNFTVKKF
jgi:hypothetical protein